MFTKVLPFLRATACVQQICRKSHDVPAHWKTMRQIAEETKSHMNFIPVPEGCWQEAYNKQNSKWNKLIIVNTIILVVTVGVLWASDVVYLHGAPPMYSCNKK